MKGFKYRFVITFSVVFVSVLVALGFSASTFAASYHEYQAKALGYGIYRCYTQANVISPDVTLSKFEQLDSIIDNKQSAFVPLYTSFTKQNCRKFIGDLLGQKGLTVNGRLNDEQKKVILDNMGYKPVGGGDCFHIISTYGGSETGNTKQQSSSAAICSSDGTVSPSSIAVYGENYGVIKAERFDDDTLPLRIWLELENTGGASTVAVTYQLNKGLYGSFSALKAQIINDLIAIYTNSIGDSNPFNGVDLNDYSPFTDGDDLCLNLKNRKAYTCINKNSVVESEQLNTGYTINGSGVTRTTAAFATMKNVFGTFKGNSFNGKSDLAFTKEEKYALYQYYLDNYYKVKKICENDEGVDWAKTKKLFEEEGSGSTISQPTASGQAECYVVPQKNKKKKVYGIGTINDHNSDTQKIGYFDGTEVSLADVLEGADVSKIPNFSLEELKEALEEKDVEKVDPETGEVTYGGENGCYDAVGSQGWILCPAMENMTSVADGLDGMVDDLLSFNVNYLKDRGAETTWGIFRNIANVVMIIVLLIIIFSQLTGYGIDNYGIKKMLPKLIIMAILINLSFIVCELAIDLSNILGVGLNDLFRNFGNNTYTGDTVGQHLANIVTAIFGTGATAGASISVTAPLIYAVAQGGGPMIVISLILVLLIALVSVLLFFLMIGARMVIILIFTVISPLAFACYILPNTQSVFKQWWKIFKAALVVYPICGALYGMSFMIRSLVNISDDLTMADFPMLLVSAVAPFLPFILLPTLLRSMLNTLGALGGTLTTLGNGLRNGLRRGNETLQNTNAYKSAQETQRRNMTRWQAGLNRDGSKREVSGLGRFLRGGKGGMSGARAQYLKDQNSSAREDSYMGEGFDAASIAQQKAVEADQVKDYMTLINNATRNGEDKAKLNELFNRYATDGNKSAAVAAARIAGRRKDTAVDFMDEFRNGTRAGRYNTDITRSIAKEISTGENSGVYRMSSPLGFGWTSDINKAQLDANGNFMNPSIVNSDAWASDNASNAIGTFVTKSSELMAVKGSELRGINALMESGAIDSGVQAKLRTMANELIEQRDKIPFDYSKAKEIAEMSGNYTYDPKAGTFVKSGNVTPVSQGPTELNVPHGNQTTPVQQNIESENGTEFIPE